MIARERTLVPPASCLGYTYAMWRAPIVLAEVLPTADDPAVAAILEGLCTATGASGCELHLRLQPDGKAAVYRNGTTCAEPSLVIELEPGGQIRATCTLCGAGRGPVASPAAISSLRPLLDGALLALVERCNSSHQLEVVADILGASEDATLLVDGHGEIVYVNARGDALLSMHTEQPMARLGRAGTPTPLLHLVGAEISALRASAERSRRQSLVLGDGMTWELEVVTLSGRGSTPYTLVILAPYHVPTGDELRTRFASCRVTARESAVLAAVLEGMKAVEIADRLGITEYTVKDHLKHAYAKLGINSRSQLLARVASS